MSIQRNLSADWARVLSQVEQALAQAVARIEQRDAETSATLTVPTMAPLNFEQLAAAVERLRNCPARVAQSVAKHDGELQGQETALRELLDRCGATRRQLAAWMGGAVS
jgi:hypothetical protein